MNQSFTLLGIALDYALIVPGLPWAIAMRLDGDIREFSTYMTGPNVSARIVFVALTYVVMLYSFGLYDARFIGKRRDGVRREILVRLVQAFGAVYLALAVFYYLDPSLSLGRGIVAMWPGLLIMPLMLSWRWMIASPPQLRL